RASAVTKGRAWPISGQTLTRRSASALALGAILLSAATPSHAEPGQDARAEAQKSFDRAEQAYQEERFAEALAAYREAAEADPSARFALTARARAADLAAHAEGDFAPLTRLSIVRRDPAKSSDHAVIEALERDVAAFPPGRVRGEAALVIADAWWHRLGEPRRAVAPLEAAVADEASDRLTRSLALGELTRLHRELGDLDAALAAVERFPDLAPTARAEVRKLVRRGHLRAAAAALLAALGVVGLASIVRAAPRIGGLGEIPRALLPPIAVAFSLYLGGAAAVLVRLRGDGDPRPFVWLGLGVLAVFAVARAWRLGWGAGGPSMRAARGVLGAAGVLAAAFLAVERTNASYLEGLGL
ncbi:MAG: tetratricopeptide repeat protein, partial [Byssovorax sp.]